MLHVFFFFKAWNVAPGKRKSAIADSLEEEECEKE